MEKSWKRCKYITKYEKNPKNLRSTAVFAKLSCAGSVAQLLRETQIVSAHRARSLCERFHLCSRLTIIFWVGSSVG